MMHSKLSIGRVQYLDLLRGVAILYIVGIHHLDDYALQYYYNRVEDVITMVFLGLFVFLSGYLLTNSNPEIENLKDVFTFFRKRFLRVYPLYLLALFAFRAFSFIPTKSAIRYAVFINMVTGEHLLTLWFVEMICVFYILYPFILYRYHILKTIIVYVALSGGITFFNTSFSLFDERLVIYLPLFLFGILVAKHNLLDNYFFNKPILAISTVCFIFVSSLSFENGSYYTPYLIIFMLCSLPITLFIGKLISSFVNSSISKYMAYTSYCMYLFHRVFYKLLLHIYSPQETLYILMYLTLVGIPLIYIASYTIQRCYDRSLQYLLRKGC